MTLDGFHVENFVSSEHFFSKSLLFAETRHSPILDEQQQERE